MEQMSKKEWQQYYDITDYDISRIELALSYGKKIVAVNDKALGYEILRYNR